jgi:DNA repair exonuclease SbcCD nuclease subunit
LAAKLLLFSDLHLDRPFRWASAEGRRTRRRNLRDTLSRIVDLAGELEVDALCCGGDLYEHEHFVPDTGDFLRGTFEALYPIPVLLAPGNHDWYGPGSLYHHVEWSPNVVVFSDAHFSPVELVDGLTVWGAGHQAPAGTRGPFGGFHVDRGGANLAMFHGSEVSGFTAAAEQDPTKVAHAPFRVEEVPAAGFDHALLGHYHRPHAGEHHTYPGNPDPLEFGEDGQRGAVLVTVGDGSVSREWFTVSCSDVGDVAVDLSGVSYVDEARQRVSAALAAHRGFVRLTLHGEVGEHVDVHSAELSLEAVAPQLEELVVRVGAITVAYDLDAIAAERSVRGQFVRSVEESADLDEEQRRRVIITGLRALAGRNDLAVR